MKYSFITGFGGQAVKTLKIKIFLFTSKPDSDQYFGSSLLSRFSARLLLEF